MQGTDNAAKSQQLQALINQYTERMQMLANQSSEGGNGMNQEALDRLQSIIRTL